MKRKLVIFMLFCIALSSLAATIASGTCGKDDPKSVRWELSDDSLLIISGRGAMEDFDKSVAPWLKHHSFIKQVKVEDGVTSIGSYAFAEPNKVMWSRVDIIDNSSLYCDKLESVTIGKSLVSIGDWAFYDCRKLQRVIVRSDSLLSIGREAFSGCWNLEEINLPNSVQLIAERAFHNCRSLLNIVIPNSVQTIEKHTFSYCAGLKSVTIPNSVKEIKESAFDGCDELPSIHLPASVIAIGEEAIPRIHITVSEDNPRYCAIEDVFYTKAVDTLIFCIEDKKGVFEIPNTVKHIAQEAFSFCQDLTEIVIPNSVVSIDEGAFQFCHKLKKVIITNSVVSIGDGVFSGCNNLISIYLQCEDPDDICGILYTGIKLGQCTFYVPKGSGKQYEEYMFNWRESPNQDDKEIPWGEFGKIVEYDYK